MPSTEIVGTRHAASTETIRTMSVASMTRRTSSVMPEMRRLHVGRLTVHIKRARNLMAMDSNGFSDPFAVVYVHTRKRFRTRIIKKTLDPVWDQVRLSSLLPRARVLSALATTPSPGDVVEDG